MKQLVFLMAWLLSASALAQSNKTVEVYWAPSTTDIAGAEIDPAIVFYHVWVWYDGVSDFVDHIQTADTRITINPSTAEFTWGMCYPMYVTAERTDSGLMSDPSGTVTVCFTSKGKPYDGSNPPAAENEEVTNGSKPMAPAISIKTVIAE